MELPKTSEESALASWSLNSTFRVVFTWLEIGPVFVSCAHVFENRDLLFLKRDRKVYLISSFPNISSSCLNAILKKLDILTLLIMETQNFPKEFTFIQKFHKQLLCKLLSIFSQTWRIFSNQAYLRDKPLYFDWMLNILDNLVLESWISKSEFLEIDLPLNIATLLLIRLRVH